MLTEGENVEYSIWTHDTPVLAKQIFLYRVLTEGGRHMILCSILLAKQILYRYIECLQKEGKLDIAYGHIIHPFCCS